LLFTFILDLIFLENSSTRFLISFIIRFIILVVYIDFRGFLFFILVVLSIRIDVEREASNQLSPLHMLAIDNNGAVLGYLPLLGV